MRSIRSVAAASVLALALAACSGESEDAAATDEATPAADATPADGAIPEATPSEGATPEASATPTDAPSAAATPAQAAAAAPATPPASFTQCGVCHSIQPGQNGIGPSLAGVAGRRSASVAGFSYTNGMKGLNVTWNDANLDRYLTNPQAMVPGTTMAIGPLSAGDRAAIIAYLKTL